MYVFVKITLLLKIFRESRIGFMCSTYYLDPQISHDKIFHALLCDKRTSVHINQIHKLLQNKAFTFFLTIQSNLANRKLS